MKKVTRRDYEAWHWLPIHKWNVDTLMGPELEYKIFCKICDEYVIRKDASEHINRHIAQRKRQIASDRKKAREHRMEMLRLAREAKKQEKMAGNS